MSSDLSSLGCLSPINLSSNVYLIKVPKFIATQWKSHDDETIVGVLVDPKKENITESETLAQTSAKKELHANKDNTKRYIILSSNSTTLPTAPQMAQLKEKDRGSFPMQITSSPNEFQPFQQLRSLRVESSKVQNVYLLSHRSTDDSEYDEEFVQRDSFGETSVTVKHSFQKKQENDYHQIEKQNENTKSIAFSKDATELSAESIIRDAPSCLAVQAVISNIWTLVPEFDSKYHALLKLRNTMTMSMNHSTHATKLLKSPVYKINGLETESLFRYYQPNAFTMDDFQKGLEQRRKAHSLKGRCNMLRHEPGSADAVAREDALKQKLFEAFENSTNNGGCLTFNEILKVSKEPYRYVKGVLSQIAEPVRTSERRRLIYALKEEFRHTA